MNAGSRALTRRWLEAERCGAWMPQAQEPCARVKGHKDCHRTAYALECNRMASYGYARSLNG